MLYELASGVHPFTSSNPASTIARVLESDPPDVAELRSSCPPALNELIHRCLQKDPTLRYGSTRELVAALEQLRRDLVESKPRSFSAQTALASQAHSDARTDPVWWWQFHQAVVGVVYYLTLIPMWIIRGQTPGRWGALLFLSMVAAVGVAATLRFNLWFTSRFNPAELKAHRARVFWPVRTADCLFVLLLLIGSALVADTEGESYRERRRPNLLNQATSACS